MSDFNKRELRFHQEWLGMIQPANRRAEGIVVAAPVLAEAQLATRRGFAHHKDFLTHFIDAPQPANLKRGDRRRRRTTGPAAASARIDSLQRLFTEFLKLPARFIDTAPDPDLSLYIAEAGHTLRPHWCLRKRNPGQDGPAVASPAAIAGHQQLALVWEFSPEEVPELDKPANKPADGPHWHYPIAAQFERLLRECHVPMGLLSNGTSIRLIYAPHGEATGWLTFDIASMAQIDGRPLLDAFTMLLEPQRLYKDPCLLSLMAESRHRQAHVTEELAAQVLSALETLLAGFETAARRDGIDLPSAARIGATQDIADPIYGGLLTTLLRLVFVLYAEERELLPVEHPMYAQHLSLHQLFADLQADDGEFADVMHQRFGAWPKVLSLFRLIYDGVDSGSNAARLFIPARRGDLFDPTRFPFLEKWPEANDIGGDGDSKGDGDALAADAATAATDDGDGDDSADPATFNYAAIGYRERAAARVPTVSDGVLFTVLRKLLVLRGERLSYKVLTVEQIGSVYESLMGYDVARVTSPAVCISGSKKTKLWIESETLLQVAASKRQKWLKDNTALTAARLKKIAAPLKAATSIEEMTAALSQVAVKGSEVAAAGRLVLQPGAERQKSGSHYTPRSLTEPMVAGTLQPLIACLSAPPTSEELLSLKVCDPAMGSGAFLVAACRYLGDRVAEAWGREGDARAADPEDAILKARRLVAQTCLYGVDKNPFAVQLAKLSLWLVTLAKNAPFTFVDHALRHGDSLVGLSLAQIERFSWLPDGAAAPGTKRGKKKAAARILARVGLFGIEVKDAMADALAAREQIAVLAREETPENFAERERLLADAEDAIARVRTIADVALGAFFSESKDKARDKARTARRAVIERWLAGDADAAAATTDEEKQITAWQRSFRGDHPAFHWMIEFPEVFIAERPDPLDHGTVNGAAMMDAFVGNPPFGGKNAIADACGGDFVHWLKALHAGAHGNADLSAHFFRRAADLLGTHGTMGLVASNTICQGDTRTTGLHPLCTSGFELYEAEQDRKWEGAANVTVSTIKLATGEPALRIERKRLDGAEVADINSRLRPAKERVDAVKLVENRDKSFQGTVVLGMGFVLTPEEREALVAKDARNGERIFSYLGGKEVNTSPTQSPHRYVISFGDMSLEEASAWPDLLAIVRDKVKPERDKNNRANYRNKWWQFGEVRPGMYAALVGKSRCLVSLFTTKHLTYSWQGTTRVFANSLWVYPLEGDDHLALLQSRVHAAWAWLLSSSLEDRLRYTASDVFETFPFPRPQTMAALDAVGKQLDDFRAQLMVERDQGLTTTYNQLTDPDCTDADIIVLRRLHEQMDRDVLAAYGWQDLHADMPSYGLPVTDADRRKRGTLFTRAQLDQCTRYENAIIDRLFELNADLAANRTPRDYTATAQSLFDLDTNNVAAPRALSTTAVAKAAFDDGAKIGRNRVGEAAESTNSRTGGTWAEEEETQDQLQTQTGSVK